MANRTAGPTAENTSSLVNTIARNVTATVAADAVIALPMDNAFLTAMSDFRRGAHKCDSDYQKDGVIGSPRS